MLDGCWPSFVVGNLVGLLWLARRGRRRRRRLPLVHELRQLPARRRPPHRVPRRLPGADRGAPARAAAVPRALRRLRPAHRLAPLERPRRHLPRARARRLLRLGLREAGRDELLPRSTGTGSRCRSRRRPARSRPAAPAACRRCSHRHAHPTTSPYPGIITATIGTFLLVRRARHLARRRAAQALATSGGTRSTSPPTPGSRSPGST